MLNQVVLVGRLTRDISVNKSDKGSKVATITLAVPRSFKNADGNYDTDFIDCKLWDGIAENASVAANSVITSCFIADIVPNWRDADTSMRSITVSSRSSSKTFTNGLLNLAVTFQSISRISSPY